MNHPAPGEMSGGPNHARTEAVGDQVIVTVGPEFERAAKDRHHRLDVNL